MQLLVTRLGGHLCFQLKMSDKEILKWAGLSYKEILDEEGKISNKLKGIP